MAMIMVRADFTEVGRHRCRLCSAGAAAAFAHGRNRDMLERFGLPPVPSCTIRRSKRYQLDGREQENDEADSDSKSEIETAIPGVMLRQRPRASAVPVCGVQLLGGEDATISELFRNSRQIESQVPTCGVQMRRESQGFQNPKAHLRNDQRPAWDSSWKHEEIEDSSAALWASSACMDDVAAVGVCGVRPLSQRSCTMIDSDISPSCTVPFQPSIKACASRARDVVTTATAIRETEGKLSFLSQLLQSHAIKQDQRGLIKRFEPYGGRLFVTDKSHACNLAWLQGHQILTGRAVRCLRAVPNEEYPQMKSLEFAVDDVVNEPILGYHVNRPENMKEVAECRRDQIKYVLEFIHEGILRGESVLVHCRMGTNRSVTVAVSYLVIYHRMTCKEAIELIQKRGMSTHVVRQPGFTEQLILLQQEVWLQRSVADVSSVADMPGGWNDILFGYDTMTTAKVPDVCKFLLEKFESQTDGAAPGIASPLLKSASSHAVDNPEAQDPCKDSYPSSDSTFDQDESCAEQDEVKESAMEDMETADIGDRIVGGLDEGDAIIPDCVTGVVEMLENQIWHRKVLMLEKKDNRYVLCVSPPSPQTSMFELILNLEDVKFEIVSEREFEVQCANKEWKFCVESAKERDDYVRIGKLMSLISQRAMQHHDEDADDLADDDFAGKTFAVAKLAHLVVDDAEEEVWL